MVTPSNGDIFRLTGHFYGEFLPSTLPVLEQLSNGGGESVGNSPAESGFLSHGHN